jgi:hypothetical protein
MQASDCRLGTNTVVTGGEAVIAKGTILVVVVSILLVGSWSQGKTGLAGDKDEIAELRKQVALLEARVYTLERRLDKMTQPRMIPIQR